METDDKPFHCSVCGQKFANNDHLERHKQKHQLTLKFGSLKTGETNVADQTPTPTRFLRNLEDEGLFQDLDNPFDQDFKQAAPQLSAANKEAASSNNNAPRANSATAEKVTVLPQQAVVSVRVEQPPRGQSQVVPHTTIVEQKSVPKVTQQSAPVSVLVRVPHHIPAAIPASIAAPNAPVPSALPVPGHFQHCVSSSSMPIPSIPTPAIMLSPTSSNPPLFVQSAKQKLKEQLRQHQQQQSMQESHSGNNIISRAMTEAVDMITENGFRSPHQLISGHGKFKEDDEDYGDDGIDDEHYMDTKRSSKRPRRSQEDLDPDERRRRFLERNRAAATRCREKRKIWVQQLEKKADDLADTNSQLQNEIGLLRSEVAQLKSLLLAHKDCPVTLAQRKLMQGADLVNPGRQGCESNGVTHCNDKSDNPTAEDVATSALTQMAHRATLELESLANSS